MSAALSARDEQLRQEAWRCFWLDTRALAVFARVYEPHRDSEDDNHAYAHELRGRIFRQEVSLRRDAMRVALRGMSISSLGDPEEDERGATIEDVKLAVDDHSKAVIDGVGWGIDGTPRGVSK